MSIRDIYTELGREYYIELVSEMIKCCMTRNPVPDDHFAFVLAQSLVDKGVESIPHGKTIWNIVERLRHEHPLVAAFKKITPRDYVLFKTPQIRYRNVFVDLPRPCTLQNISGIVRTFIDNISSAMVSESSWTLEWENDYIRFVPDLKHQYSCVLTISEVREPGSRVQTNSEEILCLNVAEVTEKLNFEFSRLSDGLEDVPEELSAFLSTARATIHVHVYNIRTHSFVPIDLNEIYKAWVAAHCE